MRFFLWAKREFLHIFPVFVFFCITFSFINATEKFLFEKAGVTPFTFVNIVIAAALIAKIFLVIDHLSVVDLFPRKPLIYKVVWKTFLYWLITLFVRLCMRFAPFLLSGSSLPIDYKNFILQVNWHLFAAIQAWYFMLLFFFVISRELTVVIGHAKMRRLFFGK